MKNKNILSIDISTELRSVAIQYKKKIFTKKKINIKNNNQNILVLINKIIKKNNINLNKIHYFIINNGPGSIISKNITLNIAQTFSLRYKNFKLIKINTFNIIKEKINKIKKYIKIKKYYILIYNSIIDIHLCYIKNNNLVYKQNISLKKIIKKIYKTKKLIITNKLQSKKKILNFLISKKNIKVIYPEAKYMISIVNKQINF